MDKQPTLPRRQLDVLRCVANGLSNEEAAVRLCLSIRTVEEYLARASRTFGTRGRAHTVAVALARGLIRIEEINLPRRDA